MRKYIVFLIMAVVISVSLMMGCSEKEETKEKVRSKDVQFTKKCTGEIIIICRDKLNAESFRNLLRRTGFLVDVYEEESLTEVAVSKADLIILTPDLVSKSGSRRKWTAEDFERFKGKKIIAMGEPGSRFLGAGKLLIGDSHGWHGTHLPKVVCIPDSLNRTAFHSILKEPCPIAAQVDKDGYTRITLVEGEGILRHIGIYDNGAFPKGTLGIGRELDDLHHWMIAKQGNYVLWGVNSSYERLTENGLRLFVNLCDSLIGTPAEQVIFPKKRVLKIGKHRGTLTGGHRDIYYLIPKKEGLLQVQLEWEQLNTMMLRISGAHRQRKDGHSPLSIQYNVSDAQIGKEFKISIGSFQLPEGKKCPYVLVIECP